MATSNTYAWAPSLADLFIEAFARLQIRRSAITAEQLQDAAMSANLTQVQFANRGVNLWTVELASQAITAGTASYNLDERTLGVLAAYIETGTPAVGRMITSISRDDYAAIPNKTDTGAPTLYWIDRQTTPVIKLHPVPDSAETYTLKFYRGRRMQDVDIAGGLAAEIPYRFIEAYVAELTLKLMRKYPPTDVDVRADVRQQAAAAWREAANADTENTPLVIAPGVGGYMRGAYH